MTTQLMHVDYLVVMSEKLTVSRNKFRKWKKASGNKGLKVSLMITEMMFSSSIKNDGLPKIQLIQS